MTSPYTRPSLGGGVTSLLDATPGCSSDGKRLCTRRFIRADPAGVSRAGVDTYTFAGPVDDGGTIGTIGIQLDSSRLAVDSLVGVPSRLQTWGKSLDCTGPIQGNVPGEQLITGQ